jgi:uncharacterized protein (DUF2235 family)
MAGELAGDEAKKRIAIFLDGTWNTTNDNTNVWRLRALTAPVGADQVRQSIYYNAGLGTQVGSKVRGGSTTFCWRRISGWWRTTTTEMTFSSSGFLEALTPREVFPVSFPGAGF